jgi:hypothetical protein
MIRERPTLNARPLEILREIEDILKARQRTEVFRPGSGPCGTPPAVFHYWPPRWHKTKLGEFTLRDRRCKGCGLYEGVLY